MTQTDDGSVSLDTGADANVNIDAGPATAALSRTAVDFGLVGCGTPAPADQTLSITNVGGQPLVWTATLSSTPTFAINGPAGGTVAPGGTGTVVFSSLAIPAFSGAGDTSQATVTLVTNDATKPSTEVPLKITAAGGTLSIVPLTAALGESPLNVAAPDLPVALKNTGNATITLAFTQPADKQFGLSWTNAPADVTLAPGASIPGLAAKFRPAVQDGGVGGFGDWATTAPITIKGGAMCGTNPSTLTLTGKGTPANPVVQPGSLDFGYVSCGATAAAKTFTIKHAGLSAGSFDWTASLAKGTHYVLSATSGTVAANGATTITVTPSMIPATSSIETNYYGDTITISTTGPGAAGDSPHTVDLVMTAQGAILQQSAKAVDFGSVLVNQTGTSPFTVTNVGNAAATVSYASTNPVFTIAPQAQVVTGGSSYPASAAFSPLAQQTYNGNATMTVAPGTVLCEPLPGAFTMTGSGAVSATITPNNVDFGLVNCGTKAANKTVVFKNEGATPFGWTATLGKTGGSAIYTVSPSSSGAGQLAAGASVTLTITPISIPSTSSTAADSFADTLSITTTPALQSPYQAAIHMTAQGAVLAFNPTSLSFGSISENNSKSLPFSVVNTGNRAANVSFSIGGSNPSHYSTNPSSVTANANSSVGSNVIFNPNSTGTKTATVSMSTTAVRCAPLPSAMTLTGMAY